MKTLLAGMLVLTSISAFAQSTIDVSAINERSVQEVNSDYSQHKNDIKNKTMSAVHDFLVTVGTHVGKGLILPDRKLPARRSLTRVDQSKKALINCIDQLLDDNYGGYEAPSIAQKVLLSAMDEKGWTAETLNIENATDQCFELKSSLFYYPDRTILKDKMAASVASLAKSTMSEQKAGNLVSALLSTEAKACVVTRLTVKGAWLIGAGAGATTLRCLMENGRIHQYVGAGLELIVGVGAAVELKSQERTESEGYYSPENGVAQFGPISLSGRYADAFTDSEVVTGIGSIKDNESIQGLAVGAYGEMGSISGEVGFRIFNGLRHWGALIDLLN